MPTTFTSNRYHGLVVKFSGGTVRFRGGSASVPDRLVERMSDFADRHPDYGIERGESTEQKPLTAKQKVVAEAEALGLDTSGTTAEIQARIDAHQGDEDPENGSDEAEDDDDSDSEESDDQNDDSDEDEAAEADSSEDDEN